MNSLKLVRQQATHDKKNPKLIRIWDYLQNRITAFAYFLMNFKVFIMFPILTFTK